MGILVGLFFDFSFKVVLFLEFNIYGFEVVLCDVNMMRFFINVFIGSGYGCCGGKNNFVDNIYCDICFFRVFFV